jgi:hypothetical protein
MPGGSECSYLQRSLRGKSTVYLVHCYLFIYVYIIGLDTRIYDFIDYTRHELEKFWKRSCIYNTVTLHLLSDSVVSVPANRQVALPSAFPHTRCKLTRGGRYIPFCTWRQ